MSTPPSLPIDGAVFTWPVRIYWEDTDAGGVVFYANYLKYYERARTEWFRAKGLSQDLVRQEHGVLFVVAEVQMKYHRPAKLDDLLTVTAKVHALRRSVFEVEQQILRDNVILNHGNIRIACVSAETFRPAPIPSPILSAIT